METNKKIAGRQHHFFSDTKIRKATTPNGRSRSFRNEKCLYKSCSKATLYIYTHIYVYTHTHIYIYVLYKKISGF